MLLNFFLKYLMACYLIHQIVYNATRNNDSFSAASKIFFTLFTPSRVFIFSAFCKQFFEKRIILDTEITVILPKNYHRYFTSKFKTDEIEAISGDQKRIWIGILNRSLTVEIIKKKKNLWIFHPRI